MSFKIHAINKLPEWEAEITGEIPVDFLLTCRTEALKHLNEHASLPGFRQGRIPDNVLIKNVGEMRILEETAEVALGKEYTNIVKESKLHPIARPQITVTKLAPGVPLEFKVQVVLEPEFDLPDYEKIVSNITEEDTEKRRLKILETLIKETKLDLPKKFVEAELHHTLHHFEQDLQKAGLTLEGYLTQIKKNEDEVKESWRENIINRTKTELILAKIAEKEEVKTYQELFEKLEKKK